MNELERAEAEFEAARSALFKAEDRRDLARSAVEAEREKAALLGLTGQAWTTNPSILGLAHARSRALDGLTVGVAGTDVDNTLRITAELVTALKDARDLILHLARTRWSEVDLSDDELTEEIDIALAKAGAP